jgi:hypothetical protein
VVKSDHDQKDGRHRPGSQPQKFRQSSVPRTPQETRKKGEKHNGVEKSVQAFLEELIDAVGEFGKHPHDGRLLEQNRERGTHDGYGNEETDQCEDVPRDSKSLGSLEDGGADHGKKDEPSRCTIDGTGVFRGKRKVMRQQDFVEQAQSECPDGPEVQETPRENEPVCLAPGQLFNQQEKGIQ